MLLEVLILSSILLSTLARERFICRLSASIDHNGETVRLQANSVSYICNAVFFDLEIF